MAGGIFFLWTARLARPILNQPANLFFLSEGKFFPSLPHRKPLSNSSPRGAFVCFLICFLVCFFIFYFFNLSLFIFYFFGLFSDYFWVFHNNIIIYNNNIIMNYDSKALYYFFCFLFFSRVIFSRLSKNTFLFSSDIPSVAISIHFCIFTCCP